MKKKNQEVRIIESDDFDSPDIYFIELEIDEKLRVRNKKKWESQKKWAEKNFQKIRKEIENR